MEQIKHKKMKPRSWKSSVKLLLGIAVALIVVRLVIEIFTNVNPVVLRVAGFHKQDGAWAHCWFTLTEPPKEEISADPVLEAKRAIEIAALRSEVQTALGAEGATRTQEDISAFLADFNARKKGRELTDEDLTRVIMEQIKPWSIFSKIKFKFLVDAYKRSQKQKKAAKAV